MFKTITSDRITETLRMAKTEELGELEFHKNKLYKLFLRHVLTLRWPLLRPWMQFVFQC